MTNVHPAMMLLLLLVAIMAHIDGIQAQADVCGRECKSDVQCPDSRGVCTYCTEGICKAPPHRCASTAPGTTDKKQLLVIGDSISIGWSPGLFEEVKDDYEGQHSPGNAGPASRGFGCIHQWVGNFSLDKPWDLILFNFGLHSLDNPPTSESETLANYTKEVEYIASVLKNRSKRVIWVDTTPVPLNVTVGPSRHNRDVIRFNNASQHVMESLDIKTADVYGAVMKRCPPTTGAPDHTYVNCSIQSPGGVHFPGGYQTLVDEIYESIYGVAPPPPLTCAQELNATGCVGSKGYATGATCEACYMAHHTNNPMPFVTCLAPYYNASVAHPQEAFVNCYCYAKKDYCVQNKTLASGIEVDLASRQSAEQSCSTEMDCSLNGACTSGACVCDKGWTGSDCNTLDLKPSPTISYGYGGSQANTSCWGGGPPVYDEASGQYHLYMSEIAGHCGMGVWSRMSQAAHAVSKNIEGPYTRVDLVAPTQTHNVYYVYSPVDKMHLIYHIFGADNPESCNPYMQCTNGTTPGAHGGLRPPCGGCGIPFPGPATCSIANGGAQILYSPSLNGPWKKGPTIQKPPGMPPAGGNSNPAPYIFENGTVLMIGRGKDGTTLPNGTRVINHNVFLYRSSHWNSTMYEWVKSNGVNGAMGVGNGKLPTEDPVLYKGRRGFHVLFHSHPNLSHGWSLDGINWSWSPQLIGPETAGGGDNERPRVSVDANGDLQVVYVAQLCKENTDAARLAAYVPK